MTAQCQLNQDLCPISRGDTVPFTFNFKQPDGTPLNIVDMTLTYSMRLDIKEPSTAIEQSVTFPDTADSLIGQGNLKILPNFTEQLLAGRTYCFKFILDDHIEDIFTVGRGRIKVWPDTEYPEDL